MSSKPWAEYTDAVLTKKRNAGQLEYLCVKRAIELSKKYEFDESEAERVLNIVSLFRHTKGSWKGKHFNLLPFQSFFLAYIFALKKKTGYRLITEAMLNTSKKSGKSELDGAIAVLFNFFDGENTAECYMVANKTEQALFSWEAARQISVQMAADYPDEFGVDLKITDNQHKHVIRQISTGNIIKTLPYDSSTLDGVMPSLSIIDEFHEYPDTKVPDNLKSGSVLRTQPLLLFSTTRGWHPYGPLAQKEQYYTRILKNEVIEDSIFPLIFAIDDPVQWENPKYWGQSNPGLEYGIPPIDFLMTERNKALEEGGETESSVKVKNFNLWVKGQDVYISDALWDSNSRPTKDEALKNRNFYISFDIGRTDDFASIGILFEPDENNPEFYFDALIFMPENSIQKRSRQHKVDYPKWINKGDVIAIEGDIVDTNILQEYILNWLSAFGIGGLKKICGDKYFALELMNYLAGMGHEVVNFGQNYANMNEPTLKIKELLKRGKLKHSGRDFLTWMITNVSLKRDTGGRVMMDKGDRVNGKGVDKNKGFKKIDAAVVLAMCLGCWIIDTEPDDEQSIYNNREMRVI